MVLVAQSDSTEDSQGRQLRINKKLSKAISSVPRSRFQKARPVLPSSKRPNKSSATTSTCQPVEISLSLDVKNASVSQAEEISLLGDVQKTLITKTEELPQIGHQTDIAVIDENNTLAKAENITVAVDEADKTSKKGDHNSEIIKVSSGNKQRKETNFLNKNEAYQTGGENALENLGSSSVKEENSHAVDNTCISTNYNSTSLPNIDYTSICRNPNSTSLPNADKLPGKENEKNIVPSITQGSPPKKDNENNLNRPIPSLTPVEQERTDNTITTATDKSSKYPHLTSILLKKRSEPRKEVQQKRRKKFKKDVPPERSKMTMADLIYWNPVNTKPSAKSVATVEEAPDSANEEVDCPDGELEENNVYDTVPKLVISEDGTINIDESSLVVTRNIPQPKTTKVVRADETTYSSFRKRPLTKHWTAKDTTIFYKALSLVGTDFALMEKIFPHRTRRELKHKFKREEKLNIDLINRAMYESQLTFEAETLDELIEHLNSLSDDADADAPENSGNCPAKTKKKKASNRKKKTTSTDEYLPEKTCKKKNNRRKKTKSLPKDSDDDEGSTTEIFLEETNIDSADDKEASNKRKRKTKKLPEDFVDIDDDENIVELISEETISYSACKKESNKKKRTKNLPKDSDDDEGSTSDIFLEDANINSDDDDDEEASNNKRKIKTKKLPEEDFVDINDNENIVEIISEETSYNNSENGETEKRVKPKKLQDGFIDSSVIEDITELVQEETNKNDTVLELTLNNNAENNADDYSSSAEIQVPEVLSQGVNVKDESSLNQENCSDTNNMVSHLTLASNNEHVEYVTIEYIENAEAVVEPTLLNNVMAYEVVSSEKPGVKRKRKNFKPIIPKRKQEPFIPVLLSPTNYTPA